LTKEDTLPRRVRSSTARRQHCTPDTAITLVSRRLCSRSPLGITEELRPILLRSSSLRVLADVCMRTTRSRDEPAKQICVRIGLYFDTESRRTYNGRKNAQERSSRPYGAHRCNECREDHTHTASATTDHDATAVRLRRPLARSPAHSATICLESSGCRREGLRAARRFLLLRDALDSRDL